MTRQKGTRPARPDEQRPNREMREADRTNGEPDVTESTPDSDRAGDTPERD